MAPRRRPAAARPPESGVALLIVLVVLFIIAVLMADITLTAGAARRSAQNLSEDFLMDAAIEGRFLVAVSQLLYDQSENKTDSPDDRWGREEFTNFEGTGPRTEEEIAAREEQEEAEGVRLLGDSDEVTVKVRVQDEYAKFNLNLLMHPDAKQRENARERFAVLIDRFREGTPLDFTRTKAEDLRDRVVEYLERAAPAEGDAGKVPVPKTAPWRILTPDELRFVPGFEDRALGLSAEAILYEAREPAAELEYQADPENVEPPPAHPGLLKYLTLWSGSAWVGQAAPDTWLRINLNTAEQPVLETLFYRNPNDLAFAEKIVQYRQTEKEGSGPADGGAPEADEPLTAHQYFEKFDDLKKVEGLDDAVLQRNGLTAAVGVVASDTFSLDFLAEREKATKQVRYVVRRNNQGIQTLLREVRADPDYEKTDEEIAAEEEAAASR